jgi:hypothetical protein
MLNFPARKVLVQKLLPFISEFFKFYTTISHLIYLKRLYIHYSFLDGQIVPQSRINCGSLHRLHMTYPRTFSVPQFFVIYFLLTEVITEMLQQGFNFQE